MKKLAVLALTLVLSAGIFTPNTAIMNTVAVNGGTQSAKTQSMLDLEKKKKDNLSKISKLDEQIKGITEKEKSEDEKRSLIEQKMALQNENIVSVMEQLDLILSDIKMVELQIKALSDIIARQEDDIADGIEMFKKRLVAMYVSGNTDLSSVLVGASDFFDILSRVQLIESISRHDQEFLSKLANELKQLADSKKELEDAKSVLLSQKSDMEDRRSEFEDLLNKLYEDLKEAEGILQGLATEKSDAAKSREELDAENAEYDRLIAAEWAEIERKRIAAEKKRKEEEEARKKLEQQTGVKQEAPPQYTGGPLNWPLPSSYMITSRFGPRWGTKHYGLDIGCQKGASIVAAESGVVVTVSQTCPDNFGKNYNCGHGGGYGNYVVISHNGSLSTLYGHLTEAYVREGDYVTRGEIIAAAGSTGHSTGFHLHFEVRINGAAQDPEGYLY